MVWSSWLSATFCPGEPTTGAVYGSQGTVLPIGSLDPIPYDRPSCRARSAPLDLEFAEDLPIVSFHRVQGEEKPLAHLLIRESLSHEVEDF